MELLSIVHGVHWGTWFIAKSVGTQKFGHMQAGIRLSTSSLFLFTTFVLRCSSQAVLKQAYSQYYGEV